MQAMLTGAEVVAVKTILEGLRRKEKGEKRVGKVRGLNERGEPAAGQSDRLKDQCKAQFGKSSTPCLTHRRKSKTEKCG